MKYNNLVGFQKHLEPASQGHLALVYLIVHKESGTRKAAVKNVLQCLGTTPKMLQAEQLTPSQLQSELLTPSLFQDIQVLLIQNVDKGKKGFAEALTDYLDHPAKKMVLILEASTLRSTNQLFKKAEKVGVVFDSAGEKPWAEEKQMVSWLMNEAGKKGKTIPESLALQLVKKSGRDISLLQQELEKLCSFVGEEKTIQAKDCSSLCQFSPTETIWQLGEAIFQRNPKQALQVTKALLADEKHPLVFVKQLRSQFQTEFHVLSLLNSPGGQPAVTKQFPYMQGNLLNKHVQFATAYGEPSFKKGLRLLDDVDFQLKNSGASPSLLFELLITKLATNV